MRVIIVDDEPLAQDVIKHHVKNLPELELVGTFHNAIEANQFLLDNEVDLMFLDIQMPQLTGLDFLKSLTNPPLTIFTTAFDEYAVQGFDLNIVDYLVKPIPFERFLKAVNKAKKQMASDVSSDQDDADVEDDFVFIKSDKKMMKVFYHDIIYIEGLKDYVIIRMEEGRIIALHTMKSLEVKLPSPMFTRIHRSFIINQEKIRSIENNNIEVLENGKSKELPIGKNYKENLTSLIERKKL